MRICARIVQSSMYLLLLCKLALDSLLLMRVSICGLACMHNHTLLPSPSLQAPPPALPALPEHTTAPQVLEWDAVGGSVLVLVHFRARAASFGTLQGCCCKSACEIRRNLTCSDAGGKAVDIYACGSESEREWCFAFGVLDGRIKHNQGLYMHAFMNDSK